MVDSLALRSHNQKWLLALMEDKTLGIKRLDRYPNLLYGKAFALFDSGQPHEARRAMREALITFPECALSIYTALVCIFSSLFVLVF